jgi:hypothetical protein
MLILLRESDPCGQPLVGSGLLIPGETALEIVRKMHLASPCRGDSLVLYMRRVLSGLGDGKTSPGGPPEQAAREFLERLVRRGFVEFLPQQPVQQVVGQTAGFLAESGRGRRPISIPENVLNGIEAIRLGGQTNMLDYPVVIRIARETGHPATADWITTHLSLYSAGIFRGFVAAESEKEV